jgi:hypothetical protein
MAAVIAPHGHDSARQAPTSAGQVPSVGQADWANAGPSGEQRTDENPTEFHHDLSSLKFESDRVSSGSS